MFLRQSNKFSDVGRFHVITGIKAPDESLGMDVEAVVSLPSLLLLDKSQKPGKLIDLHRRPSLRVSLRALPQLAQPSRHAPVYNRTATGCREQCSKLGPENREELTGTYGLTPEVRELK